MQSWKEDDVWVFDLSDLLESGLAALFASAGPAKIMGEDIMGINIDVELHQPIHVIDTDRMQREDGIWVNAATGLCYPSNSSSKFRNIRFFGRPPREGETTVRLRIHRTIDGSTRTSWPEQLIREAIQEFATAMTKPWSYSFSQDSSRR